MKNLYSFYADCGRMGSIQGLFIATQDKVDSIIGKEVHFGEVLGKHSDVSGDMEAKYFTLVSSDQEKIEWLEDLLGDTVSGINPFDYLYDEDEEDTDE